MTELSLQQVFNNIDNVLRRDAGASTDLDYIEQSSWLMFLKYIDSLEDERRLQAELNGGTYNYIIESEFRWNSWAVPLNDDGSKSVDFMTGSDLSDFVDNQLFPYLAMFKATSQDRPNTIQYKMGEMFSKKGLKNRIQDGWTLRAVIDLIDDLRFGTSKDRHEMSSLYETKLGRMGNAGRNGGEYYTPRPLIRAMIEVTDPQIGDTIYDGACGSAGFLCEAYEHMKAKPDLTTEQNLTLQKRTFYGKEKKPLAYFLGTMNMILHGIDAPNITLTNTLDENVMDYQEKDRYKIVLANPPFGGQGERPEIRHNFPIQTGETAYLFLQHFIKILKSTGRAAIVIKNTFLSNSDNASVSLRRELLESCNVHTILDCPGGTFQAGVKTVVLFFDKGAPTDKIWYYQLSEKNLGRKLGKTKPLNDNDLVEFLQLQKTAGDSEHSWVVNMADVDDTTFDLSVKNPNVDDEVVLRRPTEILDEIESLDAESAEILKKIRALL